MTGCTIERTEEGTGLETSVEGVGNEDGMGKRLIFRVGSVREEDGHFN